MMTRSFFTVAALAVVLAGQAAAQIPTQIAPKRDEGNPNPLTAPPSSYTLEQLHSGIPFEGRWVAYARPDAAQLLPPDVLPPNQVLGKIDEYLKPEYAAKHKEFDHLNDEVGILQQTVQLRCLPYNMPGERQESRLELNVIPTPRIWTITGAGSNIRFIHIGGEHPKDLKPSWLGHTVGHWEGDTLVTDTVGFNDEGMLENGVHHTTQLHMTARYKLVQVNGRNAILGIYTYDDPGSMTKPMKFARVWAAAPPNGVASQEAMCNENNKSR
jgi:hypothetical protein